jgi:hypothetical protein
LQCTDTQDDNPFITGAPIDGVLPDGRAAFDVDALKEITDTTAKIAASATFLSMGNSP